MRALRCRRITSERKTSTSHADPIADPLTNEGIEPRRGRGGTRGPPWGRCGNAAASRPCASRVD